MLDEIFMRYLLYKLSFLPRVVRECCYKQYNRLIFRLAGVKYGKNLRVYTKFILKKYKGSEVLIGDNLLFTSGDTINPISRNIAGSIFVNKGATLKIGNNVGISSACLRCNESIEIHDNVKIGADCVILDTNSHSLNYLDRREVQKDRENTVNAPIVIEEDVLIGARSIILKGVRIGARSVIGSGSVVSKDIPSDCIAAGNPCKVIRQIL